MAAGKRIRYTIHMHAVWVCVSMVWMELSLTLPLRRMAT